MRGREPLTPRPRPFSPIACPGHELTAICERSAGPLAQMISSRYRTPFPLSTSGLNGGAVVLSLEIGVGEDCFPMNLPFSK